MQLKIRNLQELDTPEEFLTPDYVVLDGREENPFLNRIPDKTHLFFGEIEINRLNFFIGANNSGKSRFMRGLLKLRTYDCHISDKTSYIDLVEEINSLKLESSRNYTNDRSLSKSSFEEEIKELAKKDYKIIDNFNQSDNSYLEGKIKLLEKKVEFVQDDILKNSVKKWIEKIKRFREELSFSLKNNFKERTYIPILRSLYKNEYLTEDILKNVSEEFFFKGKEIDKKIKIHTGSYVWKYMYDLQNSTNRRVLREFEEFLSLNFFEGKEIEVFADSNNYKQVSFSIDNGDYRSINEIGDGIQAIINLMFPIFSASKNEYFFIEEPETNLHPAFQRIFIETLLTNEFILGKNLTFFFTTHSNHFLDLTLRSDEVSFFQFEKIEKNKHFIKVNVKPSRQMLDVLGVNNTSVFLANTSLWVEGPTDRKYLSKFLKLYCGFYNKPYLKEDIDFAFFEYGGNLITHYLFDEEEKFEDEEVKEKINSFALSNKIYLLADSDNAKEGGEKFKRRKILEDLSSEKGNFKYQNTIVKEIENLLPVKVLHDFIPELLTDETSIKKAKKINFQRNDYKELGLGEFYKTQFLGVGIHEENIKNFKAESGTLRNEYKNKLAGFVVGSNYKYSDLIKENEELDNLVGTLYDFIKS